MAFIDHKIPYLSEAYIADVADACWKIGTVPGSNLVNLHTILEELQAHGVESIFRIPNTKRKGTLTIEIIDDDPYEFPAFVVFSPSLKMSVQKSVWSRFLNGHSAERVIIAHEIGHIMLHNDEAKQFSRDKSLQINFAGDEESGEGQATIFADHVLVPSRVAEQLKDVSMIAFTCNVSEKFAFDRVKSVWRAKKLGAIPNCEPCTVCGDFAVMHEGGSCGCHACGNREKF